MKSAAIRHTTCEKDFVLKSIRSGIRLDGRQSYDYRNLDIKFGKDYGCCEVQLGETRVLAQTSAELVKPTDTRPTEGQLFLNVELSPMASPAFENGRMSNQGVEVNRLIERCLKESRPIDIESLCLVAGEKVWAIRVDISVMNDCGNIVDCSCVAAICSLAHFKRPDVTVTGDDVVIHSFDEKEAVPLNVHHMPICTTFGFIGEGEHVIIDPEEKEENIVSGQMTLAFNIHSEMCCAQMSGGVLLEAEQLMQCAKIASVKAAEIIELIKQCLEEDRLSRAPPPVERREGLKDPIAPYTPSTIMKTSAESTDADMETIEMRDVEEINADPDAAQPVKYLGRGTAGLGQGGASTWVISDNSDQDMTPVKKSSAKKKKAKKKNVVEKIDLPTDDSEEEEVVMLQSGDLEERQTEILSDKIINGNNNPVTTIEDKPVTTIEDQPVTTIEDDKTTTEAKTRKTKTKKKKKAKKKAVTS
ncbi:exosome complex component RRP45-like isoform X3 [Hydractinia symbiolongicarpus]|uniref:exosome complex component RRP45-like isoform X3 n=1 Tax=Hydractinia symbiolongicarpus TaxID=13093 RepID=UPI00254BC4BB|nr:exosome complex component RRP45-like isoform X3 [Hydractinia symbiolongicarpus]